MVKIAHHCEGTNLHCKGTADFKKFKKYCL